MSFKPQIFGNYYLLEHIAFGGMAEIYRAKSFGASGFERELVLKRVLKNLTENPDFLTMLTNEAKLTATLQHGNIAQVFEFGLLDGIYFITMEYVEGVSLKELLHVMAAKGETLSVQEASYIAIQMCQGLDYAHRKADPMGKALHIVHCDISPDNAIIAFDANVKVADFGIARAQASFSNYKEGMVMGKFNYVAPEQAMGKPVDCRADIFSTGIVLYELLTNQHPFGRKGDVDTLIRIAKFTTGEVQPPHVHRPDVPEEISRIVMKALANDREQRYPSARHFANDLLTYLHPLTPAHLHQQLQDRLQTSFADRIAKRREARSRDEPTIRELQRQIAETEVESESASALGRPAAVPPSQRRGGARLPAIGALVAGLIAGFLGATMLAPAPPAVVFVTSEPPGATVKLERETVGSSPLALEIERGRAYLLEMALPGHEPFTKTFAVADEGLVRVEAALVQRNARVEVISDPPGASVEIEGHGGGEAPFSFDLPVGTQARIVVRSGNNSEEQTIEVEEGGRRLLFKFEPEPPPPPPRQRTTPQRRRR